MTSVSFNSTAASALSLLTGSTKALDATNQRVASGLRINHARDNAAYWSIATTSRAHSFSLSSAEDAVGLAAAVTDTAALGLEAATGIVSDIQAKLVLAQAVGADKNAINGEIAQLKEQLVSVAQSASFNGENWLTLGAGETPRVESMVASVRETDKGVSVDVIDFDTARSVLTSSENASDGMLTRAYSGTTRDGAAYDFFLIDAGSAVPASMTAKEIALNENTGNGEIDGMIAATNSMLDALVDAGAELGATRGRIAQNGEFLRDLQDITEIGIGRLIDAEMEEEATRLVAQTVQQQLQAQGLNISNNNMGVNRHLFL